MSRTLSLSLAVVAVSSWGLWAFHPSPSWAVALLVSAALAVAGLVALSIIERGSKW